MEQGRAPSESQQSKRKRTLKSRSCRAASFHLSVVSTLPLPPPAVVINSPVIHSSAVLPSPCCSPCAAVLSSAVVVCCFIGCVSPLSPPPPPSPFSISLHHLQSQALLYGSSSCGAWIRTLSSFSSSFWSASDSTFWPHSLLWFPAALLPLLCRSVGLAIVPLASSSRVLSLLRTVASALFATPTKRWFGRSSVDFGGSGRARIGSL